MTRRLLAGLLLLLTVCACGPSEPSLEHGLVVGRRHDLNEYPEDVCDGGYVYGYNWQSGEVDWHYDSCASTHEEWRNDPDTWHLNLQDCTGTDHDPWDTALYADCEHGEVTVSQDVHDRIVVGSWYGDNKPPGEPCELRQESC